MKLFKHFALAAITAALAVASAQPAEATVILTFGQAEDGPTITGTAIAGVTTINGTNIPVTVSQIDAALLTPLAAYLTLDATSTGAVVSVGNSLLQSYAGSFSITSGMDATGTNYLSGDFTDSVFGAGAALTLSASEPWNTVSFTSDVIANLESIRALSFSFADVTPLAHVEDETLASFQSSVAGTLSASIGDDGPDELPEPMTMSLLGLGLLGSAVASRRRRQ